MNDEDFALPVSRVPDPTRSGRHHKRYPLPGIARLPNDDSNYRFGPHDCHFESNHAIAWSLHSKGDDGHRIRLDYPSTARGHERAASLLLRYISQSDLAIRPIANGEYHGAITASVSTARDLSATLADLEAAAILVAGCSRMRVVPEETLDSLRREPYGLHRHATQSSIPTSRGLRSAATELVGEKVIRLIPPVDGAERQAAVFRYVHQVSTRLVSVSRGLDHRMMLQQFWDGGLSTNADVTRIQGATTTSLNELTYLNLDARRAIVNLREFAALDAPDAPIPTPTSQPSDLGWV